MDTVPFDDYVLNSPIYSKEKMNLKIPNGKAPGKFFMKSGLFRIQQSS